MTGTDGLAAFDTKTDEPVTIVFGTFNYREVIEKWIAAVHKLGYDGWRIVCMDRELIQWLEQRGDGAQAVDYYAVLPDAPRYDFGALSRGELMNALMALRTRLFLHLARAGCDFLHSDADAFWMQDPRPYLAQHREYDLLMSQGISCPFEHYQRFGFVVCAGFFVCRANARTRAYFERIEALVNQQPLDQQRMNLVLKRDREGRWEIHRPVLHKYCLGKAIQRAFLSHATRCMALRLGITSPATHRLLFRLRLFLSRGVGGKPQQCERARETRWRIRDARWEVHRPVLSKRYLCLHRRSMDMRTLTGILAKVRGDGLTVSLLPTHCCIVTSESVIRGRFSGGLTVGVIPMHLVTRSKAMPQDRSLVAH